MQMKIITIGDTKDKDRKDTQKRVGKELIHRI